MIRSIRKREREREWNYRGDTVRLLSKHTSRSLHLALRLMCFCVSGSSQKRHSVWCHLPGAVGVFSRARVHVCVCGRRSVCEGERQGDEMVYDGGEGGGVGGYACVGATQP